MPSKPDKPELERLLSSYIDGACSDAERQQVESALRTDPALRALHADLTKTIECVRGAGAESAPSHLQERILSQLERRALLDDLEPSSGSSARRLVLVLATAAVLLVAAGAGWYVYTTRIAPPGRTLLADSTTARSRSLEKTIAPARSAADEAVLPGARPGSPRSQRPPR